MLIGTAIIEAGSNRFSDFDWGEDLVKAINSLMDKENQITVETTGHELGDAIGRLGKHARRAIEKYPIDEPTIGIFRMCFKFLHMFGQKNTLIILVAVLLTACAVGFGGMESIMYNTDPTMDQHWTDVFKSVYDLICTLQSIGK